MSIFFRHIPKNNDIEYIYSQHLDHNFHSLNHARCGFYILLTQSLDQCIRCSQTIKQQQQRLNDLKKLLQRELKVQTIPSEQSSVTGTVTYGNARTKDILPAVHAFTPQFDTRNPHQVAPAQPRTSNSVPVAQLPNCSQNNAGFTPTLITTSSSSLVTSKNSQSCDSCQRPYCAELDEGNYITDTNFRYLKHVVLKFMLSRETEVCITGGDRSYFFAQV